MFKNYLKKLTHQVSISWFFALLFGKAMLTYLMLQLQMQRKKIQENR